MSGKTARRARRNRVSLMEMSEVFTVTLSDMMTERGIDFAHCDKKQVKDVMRECCNQYRACHEELLRWVEEES